MSKMDQFTHKLTYHNGPFGLLFSLRVHRPILHIYKIPKKMFNHYFNNHTKMHTMSTLFLFFLHSAYKQLYGSLKRQSFIIAIRKYHTERCA